MEHEQQPPPIGMKPWLRVVLVISLALNLMVIGIVGGRILMWDKADHHAHRLEQFGGPMSRALSHEDRVAIGRELRRAYREKGMARGGHRQVFEALITALRAETFDRDAVAGHMARQREMFGERLTLAQGALLKRLEQMDMPTRAAFADRLQKALERRAHRAQRGHQP